MPCAGFTEHTEVRHTFPGAAQDWTETAREIMAQRLHPTAYLVVFGAAGKCQARCELPAEQSKRSKNRG